MVLKILIFILLWPMIGFILGYMAEKMNPDPLSFAPNPREEVIAIIIIFGSFFVAISIVSWL